MKTKKTVSKVGRCNAFPSVWAAIFGCEGEGKFTGWQAPTTSGGSYRAQYGACACARTLTDGLPDHARSYALRQISDMAGVENYRHERTEIRNGRPCLAGREPLVPFSERWPALVPMRITGWVSYNFAGEVRRAPLLEV